MSSMERPLPGTVAEDFIPLADEEPSPVSQQTPRQRCLRRLVALVPAIQQLAGMLQYRWS